MSDPGYVLGDYPPKIERIPLDPDVVALLHKILDINGMIVKALCYPPIIGTPIQNSRSEA